MKCEIIPKYLKNLGGPIKSITADSVFLSTTGPEIMDKGHIIHAAEREYR